MRRYRTIYRNIALTLAASLALAGCGGAPSTTPPAGSPADGATPAPGGTPPAGATAGAEPSSVTVGEGDITIQYALWEAAQLPAYEACAEAFTQANPGISIEILQQGWDDYWNMIVTGLVSGDAPDVFTDHLSRYPEFAANEQILPIDEFVERDGVDVEQYFPGLADLWVDLNGVRYGLPKDWDTIALFYNKEMVADAGVSEEDLGNLEWNPTDGGTFEETVAKLTVDANGVRGDEPGFDKENVEVFGLGLQGSGGNGHGQQHWGHYAVSNDWEYTNEQVWGNQYFYDDPKFVEMVTWHRSLIEKGYMNTLEEAYAGVGGVERFGSGGVAMQTDGSWTTRAYYGLEGVDVGLAPVPIGPIGERRSMFNGLADTIYAGTEHVEESWQWVKFLASTDCQDIVGEHAVVFPAITSSTDIAKEQYAADDIEAEAFTVHVDEDTTFLFPITEHASDIYAILVPTMDAIYSFQADPQEALTEANAQINALFE
jgi:multiple sugar transport system substrate-binding protein